MTVYRESFQNSFYDSVITFFSSVGDGIQGFEHVKQALYHWAAPPESTIILVPKPNKNTIKKTINQISKYNIKMQNKIFVKSISVKSFKKYIWSKQSSF
jgi:hypothetical protein